MQEQLETNSGSWYTSSDEISKLPARERVGVSIEATDAKDAVQKVIYAENCGVRQVWMTAQGVRGADLLTTYAAVGSSTSKIRLGTAIVPMYTRHPLVVAQQALSVNDLAPGRLRLGLGTSSARIIEDTYGLKMTSSLLEYMREYVSIARDALWSGKVDGKKGEFFNVSGYSSPRTAKIPILVAALGEKAFRNAGEISDGVISWMCPIQYLLDKAIPAIRSGAKAKSRPSPPIVAHVAVVLTEDESLARSAVSKRVGFYANSPFYSKMFAASGFPISPNGGGVDKLASELLICGSEKAVEDRLMELLAMGLDELLVNLNPVSNEVDERKKILKLVGSL